MSNSSFELAALKLGFNGRIGDSLHITAEEEQEAFLKIIYYAGYLEPDQLWQDLSNIGGINNPRAAFEHIYDTLLKSNALRKDANKFNPALLRKSLFGSHLDEQDAIDFLLYISQNAFSRKIGEERDSLKSLDWMKNYKNEYFEATKILGLISRIEPKFKSYDFAWIAGRSYAGLLARIVDYFFIIAKYNINIKNQTYALTGGQEIDAKNQGVSSSIINKLFEASNLESNIDSLDISLTIEGSQSTIEEGKKYIAHLAQKFNLKLKDDYPFIAYQTDFECPFCRNINKLYPNYELDDGVRITESSIAQDLLEKIDKDKIVKVVDTPIQESGARPTTATTVNTAMQNLVKQIRDGDFGDKKHFNILLQSNQPYVKRQNITTQQEVNKVLNEHKLDKAGYEINIDGVGFSCKEEIPVIHSVFGALIAEKWGDATSGIRTKRNKRDLLFQTRHNKIIFEPHPCIKG